MVFAESHGTQGVDCKLTAVLEPNEGFCKKATVFDASGELVGTSAVNGPQIISLVFKCLSGVGINQTIGARRSLRQRISKGPAGELQSS